LQHLDVGGGIAVGGVDGTAPVAQRFLAQLGLDPGEEVALRLGHRRLPSCGAGKARQERATDGGVANLWVPSVASSATARADLASCGREGAGGGGTAERKTRRAVRVLVATRPRADDEREDAGDGADGRGGGEVGGADRLRWCRPIGADRAVGE